MLISTDMYIYNLNQGALYYTKQSFRFSGNDNIYLSTQSGPDVYFKIQTMNEIWYYATYSNFTVTSETDNYRLHYKTNSYKGNAGLFTDV